MEQIQKGNNWIGTNFETMISPLSETELFYQPRNIHSAAEIISHLTIWRQETILKIRTGEGSITDDDPTNWKTNTELKEMGKHRILQAYNASLGELINQLKDKSDDFLEETYYDTDFKGYYPYAFLLNGMLQHDLYHLGQLGLVIKLLNLKSGD
jgi:uncharacterized damage-inducible protein DinB